MHDNLLKLWSHINRKKKKSKYSNETKVLMNVASFKKIRRHNNLNLASKIYYYSM